MRKKAQSSVLSQEARKAIAALETIIRLEEIPVADAARHLKKTPAWIKENFPVIYHSQKSQSVRVIDLEAHHLKRIVWPDGKEFPLSAPYPGRRH
jgi:hypothetical protein